ncbi:MAG: hypothetical protein ACJ76F_11785 [Bacteroidia bacterium]
MIKQKINFREYRDFGTLFNVTFKFVKQNAKAFFSSLLLIVGPMYLITGGLYGLYQHDTIQSIGFGSSPFGRFGWTYFAFMFSAFLSHALLISVVYHFMMVYKEKQEGESISVSDISRSLFSNFGMFLSCFFGLLIITILLLAVIGGLAFLFYAGSPGLMILFLFLVIIGMLLCFPNLLYIYMAAFLVCLKDQVGLGEAISRVRFYMKENYWWTWVIIFVAYIGTSIASFIFSLPELIVTLASTFSRTKGVLGGDGYGDDDSSAMLFIIFGMVYMIGTSLVHAILVLISGFHYYSLEEKHEGTGLLERINEIK